jgi:hypothetical protein
LALLQFKPKPRRLKMPILRSTLIASLALAPAVAFAQTVIVEPPMLPGEAVILPDEPMPEMPMAGPLVEEDAMAIAMMHGMASIEDVDQRMWDGNFEVEGAGVNGEDMEILIDGEDGTVLDIDD